MFLFNRFRREEDGALLVFFALCAAAIFLVAALSFDLGRRASTQTELQSFADNVALTAAGELDGFPGAMARASAAAQNLITDSFVFGTEADGGTGRVLGGPGDYTIEFYSRLLDDENAWPTSTGNGANAFDEPLDITDPANDARARYARIIVNEVDVEWEFANILSIFSSDPLPDEAVAAEATAGFTSFACDVTPFFFCLPDATAADTGAGADPETPENTWYPPNHIGEIILLRSGGGPASSWGPGNFGWLDVRDAVPQDIVDESSDCAAETNQTDLLRCLIAAENSGIACFQNGLLSVLTGQAVGIESAVFNTRFDIFNATSGQSENDPNFAPAPLNMNGLDLGTSACAGNNPPTGNTLPLPVDDCFTDALAASCVTVGGVERFGDGNWARGRREYVEANYSRDPSTPNSIDPAEIVSVGSDDYHIDDPFRPDTAVDSGGNTVARNAPFNLLDVLPLGASRFEYYQAEVAAVYGNLPANSPVPITNDLLGPGRDETGLPTCSTETDNTNYSRDPARRNFVAAVVDCDAQNVRGNSREVLATYFIEVFLPQRIEGVSNFDLFVEIVDGPLNKGDESIEKGTFRNVVQLYR